MLVLDLSVFDGLCSIVLVFIEVVLFCVEFNKFTGKKMLFMLFFIEGLRIMGL